MSKLLIHEAPLQILPTLALKLGLNEALVLQQLHYWLNQSNKIIDNKPWIYNTYQDWLEQFPFWSDKTLRRIFSNLKEKGLVESAYHSSHKSNRTKWYTLNYAELEKLETGANEAGQDDPIDDRSGPDDPVKQRLPLDSLSLEEKEKNDLLGRPDFPATPFAFAKATA